jgi:glycine betaine/proline transport system permease protein
MGADQLSALRRTIDGGFRTFSREYGEAVENLFNPLREFLIAS